MDENILMLVIAFSFASAFAIGFFFIIYKIVGAAKKGKSSSVAQQWTKEQLNTVVTLTDDEKRSMNRGVIIGLVIVTLICGIGFTSISATYWKYVVQGEKISATVTNVDSYRSGSKRKTTKYIYSLEATVDGELVRDTYRSGSYHDADIGDIVDVYATNDVEPELALAAVEERDPLWLLFLAAFFGVFVFGMTKQRKRIATGQMKINQLSKAMRRKKLVELEQPMTPDGKPTYSIGGFEQSPPKSNDGSDYRVS
jgi:hypothetical protein